jgi:hypothetical protein
VSGVCVGYTIVVIVPLGTHTSECPRVTNIPGGKNIMTEKGEPITVLLSSLSSSTFTESRGWVANTPGGKTLWLKRESQSPYYCHHYPHQHPPKVVVECSTLFHIREVLVSNLGSVTGYPAWGFSWFSSVRPGEYLDSSLKRRHDLFLLHPFQFIIHLSPYIVFVTEEAS